MAAVLDQDSIVKAYRRWAGVYDTAFGRISSAARRRAVDLVNRLPGTDVLEVGVGTGLSLPHYQRNKRITGIDLSREMLDKAHERVEREDLRNVVALREMNAEATDFANNSFDIVVGMFVASVVAEPRRLLAEMRRLVRPGGSVLLVNHFIADKGPRRWVEEALAPASDLLGWHPHFAMEDIFSSADLARVEAEPLAPLGIFTLVRLPV
ncbi:MAG TPA: class I SAM-dependent methyltransferase [Rhodopila sp.]|nr:class I SAM-dependent methyltransferase [Rhodopila sp.]